MNSMEEGNVPSISIHLQQEGTPQVHYIHITSLFDYIRITSSINTIFVSNEAPHLRDAGIHYNNSSYEFFVTDQDNVNHQRKGCILE